MNDIEREKYIQAKKLFNELNETPIDPKKSVVGNRLVHKRAFLATYTP